MMHVSGCREPERLSDWLLGRLSPQEAADVLEHVEQCSACEQAAQAAERRVDPLVASLRGPVLAHLYEDEPECSRLLNHLGSFPQVSGDTRGPQAAGLEASQLRQIREYQLVAQLGAGGIGVVYKAVHTKLQRTVALKVLSLELERRPDAIQRFLREMEAIGRLDHPNIIRAIDAGEADGRLYLAMEYVDGIDLHRSVKSSGPLSLADACEVVRQAAGGLQYAHDQGIFHRDIKPANLMVDRSGCIKIVDLGIARFERPTSTEDGQTGDAVLTRGGVAIGTYDYMAPEQATEPQRSGRPADVYSLGCTLYFLLTGRPLYVGSTEVQRVLAHREEPIPSLSRECAAGPALDRVFRKMVAKRASDRHQSMAELVAAFEACGLLPTAHSEAAPTAEGSPLGRLVDEIPAQDLDASVNSTTGRTRESTPSRKGGHEPSSGKRRLVSWSLMGAAMVASVLLVAAIGVFLSRPRLTIESRVADVTMFIKRDGQTVETVDLQVGPTELPLWPGKYKFEVAPPNPRNVQLSSYSFTLASGEEATLAAYEPVTGADELFDSRVYQRRKAIKYAVDLEIKKNGIGMKLVLIPGGTFDMGTSPALQELLKDRIRKSGTHLWSIEALAAETSHRVEITKPFYMSVCEVTQRAYEDVVRDNPSHFGPAGPGAHLVQGDYGRLPVENVSWPEAIKFCNLLSEREGLRPCYEITDGSVKRLDGEGYRLPTEAEWEWACRAGKSYLFCDDNDEDNLARHAHYKAAGSLRPQQVGALRENGFGLRDMLGNVWEWCWDVYGEDWYAHSPRLNPAGPKTGNRRVMRGGSFANRPYDCRCARREGITVDGPNMRDKHRGFRVVREIQAKR